MTAFIPFLASMRPALYSFRRNASLKRQSILFRNGSLMVDHFCHCLIRFLFSSFFIEFLLSNPKLPTDCRVSSSVRRDRANFFDARLAIFPSLARKEHTACLFFICLVSSNVVLLFARWRAISPALSVKTLTGHVPQTLMLTTASQPASAASLPNFRPASRGFE